MSEPYLELTLTAYDNLIKAAGSRGAQVAKICNEQGAWSAEADDAAPDEPDPDQMGLFDPPDEPEPEQMND